MIYIRQINMDYSICQALKQFPGYDKALIIYDICCQWIIHFQCHVVKTTTLELADSLEIMGAIGKWHLAAHIPLCFPMYTLNFIEGASQVDGKILETLWSGLDEITGLAQAMSASHHQETVNKYMNDSNWHEAVCIDSCLF